MQGWHAAARRCQRWARQSKVKRCGLCCILSACPRLAAKAVGTLGSPSLLLSLAAGTVPTPWLDCGEASSWPLFWAMEETASSTVICRQELVFSTRTPALTALHGASLLSVPSGEPCTFPECTSLGLSILRHLSDGLIKRKKKRRGEECKYVVMQQPGLPHVLCLWSSRRELAGSQGSRPRGSAPTTAHSAVALPVPPGTAWLCRSSLAPLGPPERWGLLLAGLVWAQFWGAHFPSVEEDQGLVGLYHVQRLFLGHGWRDARSWAAPFNYR